MTNCIAVHIIQICCSKGAGIYIPALFYFLGGIFVKIPEIFGSMVFGMDAMKERLPKETFRALSRTIKNGDALDINLANAIAHAMKEWAIEKGATHYTHWFQPMTGITAEKHDSFLSPQPDGRVIMSFSGKELIKGEPDASSFPSGGLRATFEARGYTAWDPTSYAFIKEDTLYIPTAFCSYGGEALDKKTPLLRSMDALNIQAMRILRLFGRTEVSRVNSMLGPEQEYFLIDKELFNERPDLMMTGRTLIGARPSKGQELDDHYFGTIKPRVKAFMRELDEELWALGVTATTEHNEVAPAQHELAPIYNTANIATDHNQLTMELMKKIADRHGLVCLLHEKPFAGINGSGKHVNWSISTDTGKNLLDPGKSPYENAQFLLFLMAVIHAVDEHQDLLRISAASAGNDHRLGANEAPPAVISIFLGDELTEILKAIEAGEDYCRKDVAKMKIGVDVLPDLAKDTTDRNRTSPFAFTGNKFEFRMPGSNFSVAGPTIMINTIVADVLCGYADELEKAENFEDALHKLIQRSITEHKRIIFNGNGYTENWVSEAKARGLLNWKCTPEAIPHYTDSKNIALFAKHKVFTKSELISRRDTYLENYSRLIIIEGRTLSKMISKDLLPAVSSYMTDLSNTILSKKAALPDLNCEAEESILRKISSLYSDLYDRLTEISSILESPIMTRRDLKELASFCYTDLIPSMDRARLVADQLEDLVGSDYWPYPVYDDLLHRI